VVRASSEFALASDSSDIGKVWVKSAVDVPFSTAVFAVFNIFLVFSGFFLIVIKKLLNVAQTSFEKIKRPFLSTSCYSIHPIIMKHQKKSS
jgi:hypothetical protein